MPKNRIVTCVTLYFILCVAFIAVVHGEGPPDANPLATAAQLDQAKVQQAENEQARIDRKEQTEQRNAQADTNQPNAVQPVITDGDQAQPKPEAPLRSETTLADSGTGEESVAGANLPNGQPSQISDWALSGVLWSDASLVKKLAIQAARETEQESTRKSLRELADTSDDLIDAMEKFGWHQVQRQTDAQPARSETTETSRGSSADDEQALPSPEAVGNELAKKLGPKRDGPSAASSSQPPAGEARERAADSRMRRSAAGGLSRLDTQTPAGVDDPGIDDELTRERSELDIEQYRVDDVVDERPAEARNLADAVEDGTEKAIAAAASRRGLNRPAGARISRREVQTRSATLPYSIDSIYDSDDYDPDADYDIDNPLGTRSVNPESAEFGDGDDDVNTRNPARIIDGEDELTADIARANDAATTRPSTGSARAESAPARSGRSMSQQTPTNRLRNTTAIDRFTTEDETLARDANWVQFHLDANQLRWQLIRQNGVNADALTDAIERLRIHAQLVRLSTTSDQLQNIATKIPAEFQF
ncbi:hypothetical protein FYK55_13650 [Roseiconus nitratireducens]|uniref:Uncharacterized protein n=1 Tax=Roseiconus nitratireducens TaxID=2605748 RepID=A0A5M6D7W5_9BACT|nr:hypothetical protein [Roseiconus nitratireducens]KAA5542580.1 hypothetical protein FYK55_13650 [Roseiconus nitratireducens]